MLVLFGINLSLKSARQSKTSIFVCNKNEEDCFGKIVFGQRFSVLKKQQKTSLDHLALKKFVDLSSNVSNIHYFSSLLSKFYFFAFENTIYPKRKRKIFILKPYSLVAPTRGSFPMIFYLYFYDSTQE